MVAGFEAPEQALEFISPENMLKSQNWVLFRLWESDEPGLWHNSREGPEAPLRGGMLPRTAAVDGFGVKDQIYSVGTLPG